MTHKGLNKTDKSEVGRGGSDWEKWFKKKDISDEHCEQGRLLFQVV